MTFEHDGTAFDLDRTYVDVTGVEWLWTGDINDAGEPLMSSGQARPVPLPDVYRDHGPLLAVPGPTTAAMYRRVLEAAA